MNRRFLFFSWHCLFCVTAFLSAFPSSLTAVFASTPALGTASLLSFFSATCCSRLSFTPFSSRLQIRQYMILHIIHISNQFPVNACMVKITGQKKISDILFTISPITFITVFVTSTNQIRYNTETSYLLKSLQRLVQAEAMQ